MSLNISDIKLLSNDLSTLPSSKLIINTLNAHSFNIAQSNSSFKQALTFGDVLLPDGISIVWAKRFLDGTKLIKIAGADLFLWEMQRLNTNNGSCFFLGSSEETLAAIKDRIAQEYPNVKVQTYSPPYKQEFTESENKEMLNVINTFQPDVIFVGMTAPKQEIWAYRHKNQINATHICCIGAVFDFYAGTVKRAPNWMIKMGLEWLFRLLKEPRRLWKRYLIGNIRFVYFIFKEKWYCKP